MNKVAIYVAIALGVVASAGMIYIILRTEGTQSKTAARVIATIAPRKTAASPVATPLPSTSDQVQPVQPRLSPVPVAPPFSSSRDSQIKTNLQAAQHIGLTLPASEFGSDERVFSLLRQSEIISASGLTIVSLDEGFCASILLPESRQSWCIDATTNGVGGKQCNIGSAARCQ